MTRFPIGLVIISLVGAAALGGYRAGRLLNLRKRPLIGPEPDGCCGSFGAVGI